MKIWVDNKHQLSISHNHFLLIMATQRRSIYTVPVNLKLTGAKFDQDALFFFYVDGWTCTMDFSSIWEEAVHAFENGTCDKFYIFRGFKGDLADIREMPGFAFHAELYKYQSLEEVLVAKDVSRDSKIFYGYTRYFVPDKVYILKPKN